ncbi:MAG: DUF805 domain-containing protein [Thermoguttaceae bacterium]|nr:DUF805 domain-containing protein [Thermoguttaceae bacterium]
MTSNDKEERDASSVAAPEIPGFGRAITICLSEKYASFGGRACRREFWFFCPSSFFLGFVVPALVFGPLAGYDILTLFWIVAFFYLLTPVSATVFRRLHDVGLSGWTLFACLLVLSCFNPFNPLLPPALRAYNYVKYGVYLLPSDNVYWAPYWYWDVEPFARLEAVVLFVIALLWPGQRGANKYGPAPTKRAKSSAKPFDDKINEQ